MKSFGQALDLKNDPKTIDLYKRYHREVWPDVVKSLEAAGIKKMKIFLLGSHLFMYYEAPDDFVPQRDFQQYTSNAQSKEWDQLMRTFQRKVPEAKPEDWWANMELVYDLEWPAGQYRRLT